MIFYFSGQVPLTRRDWPDDPDITFFKKSDASYDRLICLMYGKEANLIINNIQKAEVDNGTSDSKRTRRRSK